MLNKPVERIKRTAKKTVTLRLVNDTQYQPKTSENNWKKSYRPAGCVVSLGEHKMPNGQKPTKPPVAHRRA